MFQVKVLNQEDTKKVLDMKEVIKTVEEVYRAKSAGDTEVFPLVFHEFQPGAADMDIKSGWLKSSNIFGLKLVSWFGDNVKKNLPALIGTVMIFDAGTGAPIGILDGSHITGMRTGAAGAIGAKLLARKNSKKLLVVGAGHIAEFQVAATLQCFPQLEEVMIYDGVDYALAEKFTAQIEEKLHKNFGMEKVTAKFTAIKDIEEAVGMSDIVITVTPSRIPIVKKEWVQPGTHFSCIGADMSGKEEIDPEIFANARVFADDIPQCINVGEIEIPVAQGILKKEDIAGEIGDILTGKAIGRESEEQITVFDATGTALLDLLTGMLALQEAETKKIGQCSEL